MAKNSGNDFIGIGVGLEVDEAANQRAIKGTEQAADTLAKGISKALAGVKIDPLIKALETLSKGVADLNKTFGNVKFDKLSKGIAEVDKQTVVMAKNFKESSASMEKYADAAAKKIASHLKMDTASAEFSKLSTTIKKALQMEGAESGFKKIAKLKDLMIESEGVVARLGQTSSKAFKQVAENLKADPTNFKLFSADKYKAEVDKARVEYQKLLDMAGKGNLGSTSNITTLGSQFDDLFRVSKMGANAKSVDGAPAKSLEFVQELRRQIAEVSRSTDNVVSFNKLYSQAERLQQRLSGLVPADLRAKLDALTTTNWDDSVKGTAKFHDALGKVKNEVTDLQAKLRENGDKLFNGVTVPRTYVNNVDKAYDQAVKEARSRQEAQGSSMLAAIRNTEQVEQRNRSLSASLAKVARDYDTLQKKVEEYNRVQTSDSRKIVLPSSPSMGNLTNVVDKNGLHAAQQALADLNKSYNDLIRTARADNVLQKRMDEAAEASRKAGVRLEELKDKSEKLNRTFANVTSKTYTNTDDRMGAVTSAQTHLNGLLGSVGAGALTPAKADEIAAAIRKVNLAMTEYTQTGSRMKDATGSPFDNLFNGIPRLQVSVETMRAQINKALTSIDKDGKAATRTLQSLDYAEFGKVQKQLKAFGHTINQTTGEITKLKSASDQSKGLFSWLPESLGGMAARLTEFYSLRTIIFAVSAQFRDATRSAIELNQAVYDILAISGEGRDKFKEISDSIYDIAKNSRFTAQEVSQLMQVLAQAGVQSSALPTVAEEVGKFATAVAADPKTAADLATTAMNVFKVEAGSVSRVTNAMTAALNLSKLEAGGLATAFNYLAPQAAQLGISMEQTLGIIANMAQSGIKASTIGTGVSQLLKEFAAPKERLRNMLKDHGLSADDINPMKREFADIVQTLQEANVGVDELFRAMETRVGRAAVTAINLSAESFRNMTASLTGTQAALLAYDKTMDGAKARMNQLKQTVSEIASNVGAALGPALVQITQALRGILTGLGAADGAGAKLVVTVAGLTIGFAALWKTAGLVYTGLQTLTGTVVTFSTVLAALKTTLQGLSLASMMGPQAAIMAGLAAIGLAIYGIGKALDYKKEKEEEANKATLEAVDRGERLDRTLNAIAHSNKDVSAAYTKYYAALKEGKSEEEALATLSKMQVEVKDEQKKALLDYIAEGGPHAKYVEGLLKEKGVLVALIQLERERRKEKNNDVTTAAEKYNNFTTELTKKKASWQQDYMRNTMGVGTFNPATSEHKAAAEEAWNKYFSKSTQAFRSDKTKMPVDINGQPVTDELTGEQKGEYRVGADGYLKSVMMNYAPKTKPKDKPAGEGSGGAPKFIPKESTNDNLLNILRARREALTDEAQLTQMTREEIEQFFSEGEVDIAAITADFNKTGSETALASMLGRINTLKEIDEAIAHFTGERAVDKAKKSGLKGTALERELATARALDEAVAKKAQEAREKSKRSTLATVEKNENDVVEGITKLKETTTKKLAEIQKRNQEKILQDGYTSDADRETAFGAYVSAEIQRVQAEANLLANKALEKVKVGSPEYQTILDERDKMVTTGIEQAYESGNHLKHAGDMASLDIRIKTEQQSLQNQQEALKMQERYAVGYDQVNALQVRSLQAEQVSLDHHKSLLEDKWMLARTADEEARIQEEIRAIELRRLKINAELKELTQSQWESFKDGATGAWNQLSNLNQLAKDLGSSLTNNAFNGLTSSISDAIGTVINPDTAKIAELNKQIADLRTQKAELTSDIATMEANTSLTPEELKALQDKKEALDSVNVSLREQESAVRKQKDAWAAFSEGLKGIMKTILKELQNYIAKLLAVWAVKQLLGFAFGSSSGSGLQTGSDGVQQYNFAKGGVVPVQHFAEGSMVKSLKDIGGWVPTNIGTPGQDSVPTMLMPGEVVIRKDMVDYYGKDFLLNLNAGKIEKLAKGGVVGGNTASAGGSAAGDQFSLQIVNVADAKSIPPQPVDAQQVINIVSFDIARKGQLDKVIKGAVGR